MNGPSDPDSLVAGRRYRVKKDYKALRSTFVAGEELIYEESVWSRYDGITGYCFSLAGGQGGRILDLYDDGSNWIAPGDLLEEVPE